MLNSTFNNVLNHQAISQDRWLKYLYEPTSPKDNYRTLHPATAEYNLKLTWNVLQIVHMLVHKTNIKNFLKDRKRKNTFSDKSWRKLEISDKEICETHNYVN